MTRTRWLAGRVTAGTVIGVIGAAVSIAFGNWLLGGVLLMVVAVGFALRLARVPEHDLLDRFESAYDNGVLQGALMSIAFAIGLWIGAAALVWTGRKGEAVVLVIAGLLAAIAFVGAIRYLKGRPRRHDATEQT
jgi:hypothetical protein